MNLDPPENHINNDEGLFLFKHLLHPLYNNYQIK